MKVSSKIMNCCSSAWWHTPVLSECSSQRQEGTNSSTLLVQNEIRVNLPQKQTNNCSTEEA